MHVHRQPREPEHTGLPDKIQSSNKKPRVLVVDAKLKTGETAIAVGDVLRGKYDDIVLTYAAVLLYLGEPNELLRAVIEQYCKENTNWPISLSFKGYEAEKYEKLKVFAAYYTDLHTAEAGKRIIEEIRSNL